MGKRLVSILFLIFQSYLSEAFTDAFFSLSTKDALQGSMRRNSRIFRAQVNSHDLAISKFGILFKDQTSYKNKNTLDFLEMRKLMMEEVKRKKGFLSLDGSKHFLRKKSKNRSFALSCFAFLSIWNTNGIMTPFCSNVKEAHAKEHGKISEKEKVYSPTTDSKGVSISSGMIAVGSSAAGVALGKHFLKSRKKKKSTDDSIKDEIKFNELIGDTMLDDPPVEKTNKVQSIEEESIKKTEEAEFESFKLAAAKKAAVDAIRERQEDAEKQAVEVDTDRKVNVALKEKVENIAKEDSEELSETGDASLNSHTIIHEMKHDEVELEKTKEFEIEEITIESHSTSDFVEEVLTKEEIIVKALKQPKAPDEEKSLSEKYAALPPGERAFTILLDLGMIELTPDPDDPFYDSSGDDDSYS